VKKGVSLKEYEPQEAEESVFEKRKKAFKCAPPVHLL